MKQTNMIKISTCIVNKRWMLGYPYFLLLVSCFLAQGKPDYHKKLNKRELSQIFGVQSHEKVPYYESARMEQSSRFRRSIERQNQSAPVSVILSAFGIKLKLNLTVNKNLIAKNHVIEFYNNDGTVEKYGGFTGEFSTGTVENDTGSFVALHHNSRGLSGTIFHKKEMYLVNPLPKRFNLHQNHIIFRRSDVSENHALRKCGFDSQLTKAPINEGASMPGNITCFVCERFLEILRGNEDGTFVQRLNNLISRCKKVAGLFKDESLEYPIDVVVTRTVMFEDNRFKAKSISDLLSGFSGWVKANNPRDDSSADHVDNAVLMTRNGCENGCHLEGFAYESLCGPNSQSVSKDHGLMSALTVAHELAHNLPVDHDTSDDCPDGFNIMATGAAVGPSSFKWSICSSEKIKTQLMSTASSCFDDVPAEHQTNSSFQLYGQVYDGDQQCKFTFGSIYKHCKTYMHECDKITCYKEGEPNTCVNLPYAYVHGTKCGDHKWCIQARCVPDGTTPPTPVDGSWGSWSNYSECSKDCGIGVQWKTRKCDDPPPSNGGRDCEGESEGHYKTCNTEDCPPGTPSFRLTQCEATKSDSQDYYDALRPCQLICGDDSTAYYFGNVKDGTRCSQDSDVLDVCIKGKCQNVGCDLELLSEGTYDRCGVCKGDGTGCELQTGRNDNPFTTPGQYHLLDIPKDSNNIIVEEVGGTFNFIGFTVGDSSQLAIPLPSYSAVYNENGIYAKYTMDGYYFPDKLEVFDKIPIKIRVYLLNYYRATSEGVTWRYYSPVLSPENVTAPATKWKGNEWSECSQTCAGGIQTRTLSCVRVDDESPVDPLMCQSLEKLPTEQSCNDQNCPAEWHVTEWTECTKSCGNGTQARQLYCSVDTSKEGRLTVADIECTEDKPHIILFRGCNAVMCPAEWSTGPWSTCSKSCGGGITTRQLKCQRIYADGKLVEANRLECSYLQTPVAEESCNMDIPCPVWRTSYTECSKSCGGGFKSVITICSIPPYTEQLDRSKCASPEPDTSFIPNKTCNTDPCEEPYHWVVLEGVCSVTCGKGLIPVKVECQKKLDNTTSDGALCLLPKPEVSPTKECDAGVCPEKYIWNEKYSSCSVTCGGGVQTTIPYCVKQSDKATVADNYCEGSEKPIILTQRCYENECPKVYEYKVNFTECSVTCAKGERKAVASCYEVGSDIAVDQSLCSNLALPDLKSRECDMGECPPVYSWLVKYGECSVTCGKGTQTKYYVCVRETDKKEMAKSFCDASKQPDIASHQDCELEACLSRYYWKAEYGYCMAPCGEGQKLKIIDCIERATGGVVAINLCYGLEVPPDQTCKIKDCQPVFNTTTMPPSYAVGCFNDIPYPRRVPVYLGNMRDIYNRHNTTVVVELCAEKAHSLGFVYFALQFYGECRAGDSDTADTFYLNGNSHKCDNGVGGEAANFVYKIGSPADYKPVLPVMRLGCYKDDLTYPRPVPTLLDDFRNFIVWKPLNDLEIVARCAYSTTRRDWKVFSIQHWGGCWSGENVIDSYARAGTSHECDAGLGKINANFVYLFYEG